LDMEKVNVEGLSTAESMRTAQRIGYDWRNCGDCSSPGAVLQ